MKPFGEWLADFGKPEQSLPETKPVEDAKEIESVYLTQENFNSLPPGTVIKADPRYADYWTDPRRKFDIGCCGQPMIIFSRGGIGCRVCGNVYKPKIEDNPNANSGAKTILVEEDGIELTSVDHGHNFEFSYPVKGEEKDD